MIIAFRRSNVVAMTAVQRKLLRMVCEAVDIVEPGLYKTGAGVVWLFAAHPDISRNDVAVVARFCAILGSLGDYDTREELRTALVQSVVWPTEGQTADQILVANGAPVWLRAGDAVPNGFTPYDPDA